MDAFNTPPSAATIESAKTRLKGLAVSFGEHLEIFKQKISTPEGRAGFRAEIKEKLKADITEVDVYRMREDASKLTCRAADEHLAFFVMLGALVVAKIYSPVNQVGTYAYLDATMIRLIHYVLNEVVPGIKLMENAFTRPSEI